MTDRERIARKLMLRDGLDDDWYYAARPYPHGRSVDEVILRYEAEAEQFIDLFPKPKLELITAEEIKVIATKVWLERKGGKFLGTFDIDDTPQLGKEIAQAQLSADRKAMEAK